MNTTIPALLTVTPAAALRLDRVLTEENAWGVRVAIRGGGCSGFQYDFSLVSSEADKDDSDVVINQDSAKSIVDQHLPMLQNSLTTAPASPRWNIVIDPISAQYLQGAQLDAIENLTESRFVFRNPNATAQCGCGQSFAA